MDNYALILISVPFLVAIAVVYIHFLRSNDGLEGFKRAQVNLSGRQFNLLELTALQRVEYMKRCSMYSSTNGYELMRNDLLISTDLIALHLRTGYTPMILIRWRVRRLSIDTIAELFAKCVELSNIPFDIKPDESAENTAPDDDWDYIDEEKKTRAAAPQ